MNECVPECRADISFSKDDKAFAGHWIIGLSALSLTLSVASLITLLVDNFCGASTSKRTVAQFAFRVPPLCFTLCCCFYSLGFLISQLFPKEDFCLKNDEATDMLIVAREGHRNQPCIVVFLLVYFFGNASSHWWTVATFSWFLALVTTKTNETKVSQSKWLSTATLSTLCHMYAWGIPAILAVTAILTHHVESDELTSVCLPGASFRDISILVFILIPESIQLFLGSLFYVIGIVTALIQKSNHDLPGTRRNSDLNVVNNLRCRMGIFGILYTLPKVSDMKTD